MNIPAATKIDALQMKRFNACYGRTRLRMADVLRIGLERVLLEFESSGTVQVCPPTTPSKKKGALKPCK